jgi:serine/threonine protein kinase
VDAAALADELARFRVLDSANLNELLAGFSGSGPAALADYLVGRGALSAFQAERALAGESRILALGPYRLTGTAGRGTFGALYTARHTSKPGTFDVRVLPLRSLWKAKQAKQLARTLSLNLKHSAVVPLVEVDSANGFHYLVWPHAEGARLADHVTAHGPLAAGEAAALLGHLVGAVAACHERGAVHATITPYSVGIDTRGQPLLLELGAGALLAQNVVEDESMFDSMSAAFAAAGVLAFAAPELAEVPQTPAPAADQYALGAVGYFALTGLHPYPHPALADQLRAKRAGPPPSIAIVNPAVPAELAAVIERMMAPNPTDRFATLTEIEEKLATLASAAPPDSDEGEPCAGSPLRPVESLMLSQIQDDGRVSGASSWGLPGPEVIRPAERDDSDASITFDLPDAPEARPDAPQEWPVRAPLDPPETKPSRSEFETPHTVPHANRPEPGAYSPTSPPDSTPDGELEVVRSAPVADPRLTPRTPVQWHTAEMTEEELANARAEDRPPPNSVLWKKVKRNFLFWQATTDVVQVSVFGPSALAPGQSAALAVYLHTPDAGANVRTLARAFQHDAELVGTGYLTREVARTTELAVHVSVANAGLAKTLLACEWRGQPRRLAFELHVPWESPVGASPGLVSVGQQDLRIGKIEFHFNVLPRKA